MKCSRKASAVALALFLPTAASLAQTASRKEEPSKWSLSLGVEPTSLDLRTRDPGVDARFVANLTRIWQAPGSRFSRHVSLMAGADAPHGVKSITVPVGMESIGYLFCQGCSSSFGRHFAGLTAGGGVDLFHMSRFTPYVQGGGGLYYERYWSSLTDPAHPGNRTFKRNESSFGLNAGLGIKAKLGSHEFFVEQMLHTFEALPVGGRGIYPLNFGIRF